MIFDPEDKQNELLQAKAYTAGLIASLRDSLIEVDAEEKIKKVNRAALDLLGYTEKEIIGRSLGHILEGNKVFFKGERLKRLVKEYSVYDDNLTYITKQGEKIPVSFTGSILQQICCPQHDRPINDCPEFKKKGKHCEKIEGIVCIARDMRQLKNLIEDLKKANAELEEWSKTLEKRVEERTKELAQAQEAALNILEDLEESGSEQKKYNKELEKKVEERTAELIRVTKELELCSKINRKKAKQLKNKNLASK